MSNLRAARVPPLVLLPLCLLCLAREGSALGPKLPFQVADINPSRPSPVPPLSDFVWIVDLGGVLYFKGYDGIHGQELWRTDGTTDGTWLVRDLCPGICSGNPASLTVVGSRLFFAADDGVHGAELWTSDGTADGTRLVADVAAGGASSYPEDLTALGSRVVFGADDGVHGREPWASDGTAAGTVLLADLASGPERSWESALAVATGKLYFEASGGLPQSNLWATDGTPAGTYQVVSAQAEGGPRLSTPVDLRGGLHAVEGPDGALLFGGWDAVHGWQLWRSDGTSAGTFRVVTEGPGPVPGYAWYFARLGDLALFAADTDSGESQLWRTDGTAAGTMPIGGSDPAGSAGNIYLLTPAEGLLFFVRPDGEGARQLWASDGTPEGTSLLKTFPRGSGYPNVYLSFVTGYGLAPLGDEVLFFAWEEATGLELWKSDGTAAGTALLSDINPGPEGSFLLTGFFLAPTIADRPGALAGHLYFRAFDHERGLELWRSDATEAGTTLFKDLDLQTSAFSLEGPYLRERFQGQLTAGGDRVFFQASDGLTGEEPWASDGSAPGTMLLGDLNPGEKGSYPLDLTALGSRVFFSAREEEHGAELWVSDGSPAGTGLVEDIFPGPDSSEPYRLSAAETSVLFAARSASEEPWRLWLSDGATTSLATADLEDPDSMASLGDTAYFSAAGPQGYGLWRRDPDGRVVGDLLPEDAGGPSQLTVAGEQLFFFARDPAHGEELWVSDGTAPGTGLVADIVPGPANGAFELYEEPPAAAGGTVFFLADDGLSGVEPWRSDGTEAGTFRLKDVWPGPRSSQPRELTAVGRLVFFVAGDGEHGRELWVTDGTKEGTGLVVDLLPGPESSQPRDLGAADGRLFLSAHTPALGREAWTSDGTAAGTAPLADLAPGPLPSSPMGFTQAGRYVFFAANDGTSGFELWAVPAERVFADGFESGDFSGWSLTVQ